jgi:cell division protein FtsL
MRLNLVLLVAVIASAMYLVQLQYQSRRLFVEVEKAQSLSRKLEIERERLEVDKRTATPAVTQYVKLPKMDTPEGGKP